MTVSVRVGHEACHYKCHDNEHYRHDGLRPPRLDAGAAASLVLSGLLDAGPRIHRLNWPAPHLAGARRSPLRGGTLLRGLLARVSFGHMAAASGFHPRAGRPTPNQGAPASRGPGGGRGAAPRSPTGPWAALKALGRFLDGGSPRPFDDRLGAGASSGGGGLNALSPVTGVTGP